MTPLRYAKALSLQKNIRKGESFTEENLIVKPPGTLVACLNYSLLNEQS